MLNNNKKSSSLARAGTFRFALLAALAVPLATLAANPDTSIRSWIQYPYQNTTSNLIPGSTSSYVDATSITSNNRYALLGAGHPRLRIWTSCSFVGPVCGGLTSHAEYEANPVYVVGPWDGTASSTLTITPPINALGAEEFGSALGIQGSRIAVGADSVFSWDHAMDPQTFAITVTTRLTGGGRVHLYQISGSAITPERTIVYGGQEERFGAALALDSEHLLVGRPGAVPGAADLFDPDTGIYITSLMSPGIGDGFGRSLALAVGLSWGTPMRRLPVMAMPMAHSSARRLPCSPCWNQAAAAVCLTSTIFIPAQRNSGIPMVIALCSFSTTAPTCLTTIRPTSTRTVSEMPVTPMVITMACRIRMK
jgi:hypothetical protein